MGALIRSLAPLWQEMVQWDTEFLEGIYPRFHDHDGLVMLAAQLKHPSLARLFLDSLESQGFPDNSPDRVMVYTALRHAASNWQVSLDESDNLDSQGTCRFFGFVALRRFGIIEPNPDGPLVLGKTQGRFSFAEEPRDGGSAVLDDYLRLDFGILPHMTLLEVARKIRVKLQELPGSQLMGGDYISPYLIRAYLGARGLDGCTQSMTVGQYLECVPDKCSWLIQLAHGMDERMVDLCHRLGYMGRTNHLSALTCMLDDARILDLLPADGDLALQMRMRLPDLLVARDAYQSIHGFSPSPYKLFELTSGRRVGGSLPPETIKAASERRAAVLAERSALFGADLHESIQCYPHDVVISRIAVLGMSAAAKVKLTPAESFALLAQASKLVSLTVDRGWASDIAAQVAFLSLSAYHDWIHDGGGERSPESAVSVGKWESALADMTGIAKSKIRIAKVRIINAMSPKSSGRHDGNSFGRRGSGSLESELSHDESCNPASA